jgi:hypothetical protein
LQKVGAVLAIAAVMQMATPAAAEKPELAGIWQGTVGNQPIRACFNEREWGTFGGYYYLDHLKAIPLQQPEGAPQTFVEGNDERDAKAPRWTIERAADDKLTGGWSQGTKRLAIQLTRVPGIKLGDFETPCGSTAFHEPRLRGVRTVQKPARRDGISYARLVLDDRGHFGDEVAVESFALEGSSAAVRRINRRFTPSGPNGADGWLSCITSGWNYGPHAEWGETFKPRMFTRRWLTVSYELGYYCGGPHPDSSSETLTFDRRTGAEVDLYEWLSPRATERVISKSGAVQATKLRPAFRELLLRGHVIKDAECREVLERSDYWGIELTRTALVFTPTLAHVELGCSDEFPMSFAALAPYLSDAGKKNVAELQAEVASKR